MTNRTVNACLLDHTGLSHTDTCIYTKQYQIAQVSDNLHNKKTYITPKQKNLKS